MKIHYNTPGTPKDMGRVRMSKDILLRQRMSKDVSVLVAITNKV